MGSLWPRRGLRRSETERAAGGPNGGVNSCAPSSELIAVVQLQDLTIAGHSPTSIAHTPHFLLKCAGERTLCNY